MNSTAPLFSTQVAFQCDDGLFPEGIMTATCLVTGTWDRNPGEIVSILEYTCLYTLNHLQLPTYLMGVALMLVAVTISVVVTAIVFTIIGLLMGLLIMYLFMHKKNVYTSQLKSKLT